MLIPVMACPKTVIAKVSVSWENCKVEPIEYNTLSMKQRIPEIAQIIVIIAFLQTELMLDNVCYI